jgi:hypothetical protein
MSSSNNENNENALKINEYIKKNPDCIVRKTITIMLRGKKTDLETYRLPLDLTYYNIKNGRFAAEYVDLVKNEGRELDPKDPQDSKKIQSLLIDIDPRQSMLLEKDLQISGQKDPGIITYDGQVINGNRRRAVLEEMVSAGHSDFRFIEVARLPPNVSSQDLWKLEAGIQLSKNVQLDYGPINELLKFKEGIDAGLSPIEIANSLYGGFKEKDILEKLEQLKLIAEYLIFIGQTGVFNKAKGVHEHFIVLRKILSTFRAQGASPDEIVSAKRIAFQLIFDGVAQMDLRKIKDILVNEKTKKEFWQAIEYSKPEDYNKKIQQKLQAEQNDEYTSSRTIFNNCLDSVKALSEAQQPEKLLRRALTNLESIDPDPKSLKTPEIVSLLSEIDKILKKIKAL